MDQRLKEAITTADAAGVEMLLREDPTLASDREGALSAVMLAAYYKQPAIATVLLTARGEADLFEASALGMDVRIAELIDGDPGGAPAARSADGFTGLHLAAYFGHAGCVRRLIEAGADIEAIAQHASKVRPLHSGVAGPSEEVVEALLSAGAECEVRQEDGFTPLMGAAAGGSERLVRWLLSAGADRSAKSDDGRTALDLAREHDHQHLEQLLEV